VAGAMWWGGAEARRLRRARRTVARSTGKLHPQQQIGDTYEEERTAGR